MAKQRYVNTKFWDDSYIVNLDPLEKFLYLYCITNPLTNISGVYEIAIKRIALDTGIDKDMIVKLLNRFTDDNKVYYKDGWIVIRNFIKHQNYKNPKILKAIKDNLSLAPDNLIPYIYPIDSLSHLTKLNLTKLNLIKPNIKEKLEELETKQKSKPEIKEPIDPEAKQSAQLLFDLLQINLSPTIWIKNPPNIESWSIDIEKLNRLDGIDYLLINSVVSWVAQDSFWNKNIMSGSKLRKQFTRLELESKGKRVESDEERLARLEKRKKEIENL